MHVRSQLQPSHPNILYFYIKKVHDLDIFFELNLHFGHHTSTSNSQLECDILLRTILSFRNKAVKKALLSWMNAAFLFL